ncbi:MAG: diadenylate cyclase [bacterium]|nr:diadenylate cyclase [bacterium]
MVLTTHAVVGGAIGRLLAINPLLAFIVGFLSHFVLDIIPHWDYPLQSKTVEARGVGRLHFRLGWPAVVDFSRIGLDFLIGLALVYWLFPLSQGTSWLASSVLWGALGAVLPDALQFIYAQWRPRFLSGLQRFHHFIHAKQDFNDRPVLGVTLQILLMVAVVVLVKLSVSTTLAPTLTALVGVFKLKDFLDIFIVAAIIYLILIFIRRTKSFFIVNSIILLSVLYYVSRYFDLSLTRQAFQSIFTFVLVIFVIVFQREIRRFFEWLAFSREWQLASLPISTDNLFILVRAVNDLARKKIGAIVVIPGEDPLERLIDAGQLLNGQLSTPLLLSIFDTSSPGHDGAVILAGDRVRRFGVHLPLSEHFGASTEFGTRHRAAVGVTERADALAIVVSEEKGTISVAEGGQLETLTDSNALLERLKRFLKENAPVENENNIWHFLLVKNFWVKLSALVIAAGLWFTLVFQIGVVNQDIKVPLEFRFVANGLEIIDLNVNTVDVTVSGSNRDLLNFKPEQIKVAVDLSGQIIGYHELLLNDGNISLPTYLSLVKIEPRYINFYLKPIKTLNHDLP